MRTGFFVTVAFHLGAPLLASQPAVAAPFQDTGFSSAAATEPVLVIARERWNESTRQQSIYVRFNPSGVTARTAFGTISFSGAAIVTVLTSSTDLDGTDSVWGIAGATYGTGAAGRGLEGNPTSQSPGNDSLRYALGGTSVNFWMSAANTIDDFRIVVQYPTPLRRARFSLALCGTAGAETPTCTPAPEGWPLGDAVRFQIGSPAADSTPDNGDSFLYASEYYGNGFIKLFVQDFDIEELGCNVLTSFDSAPVVDFGSVAPDASSAPRTFTLNNAAAWSPGCASLDIAGDNGTDMDTNQPVASNVDLANVLAVAPLLAGLLDAGNAIPASNVTIPAFASTLAVGGRTAVGATVFVPPGTIPDTYRGVLVFFDDANNDGVFDVFEPGEYLTVSVTVPPDGGVDGGAGADGGIADGGAAPAGPVDYGGLAGGCVCGVARTSGPTGIVAVVAVLLLIAYRFRPRTRLARRRGLFTLFALALLFSLAPLSRHASAAQTLDAHGFKPPGMASRFVATADTIPLGFLGHTFALSLGYAKDPLIFKKAGLKTSDVVANQIATEAEAALGVLPFLDLGVAIPFILETGRSADLSTSLPVANVGDLRVTARARLLDERVRRVGLSLSIETSVPTGSTTGLVSSGFVSVAPMLAASFRAGAFAAAVNLGYRFRRENLVANLTFDDELFYRLGAIVRLAKPRLDVIAEAFASTRAGSPWGKEVENPGEFVVAVRMPIRAGLSYTLGGGGTLLPGYGAPTARIFFGLTYASIREAPRAPEPRPLPPKEKPVPPEDPNGDADLDGVPNARDLCPYESDVIDGQAPPDPRDGCPTPRRVAPRPVAKRVDSDGDGLLDLDDDCPNAAGPKENRGCPIVDRDGDGVPDALDKCPLDPDYRDGALARDGCAVVDSDGDGVPDLFDRCPNEPTSRDVPIDEYGCPMQGPHLVLLKADRLVIKQKVRFHPGTAHIRDESRPILEQLVSILKRHESIAKLRIDGHTERVFPDEQKNIALSEEMAAAVTRYLVKRGVHPSRLAVFGYGQRRPIASHTTAAGKEENRRVEFVIMERGSAKE